MKSLLLLALLLLSACLVSERYRITEQDLHGSGLTLPATRIKHQAQVQIHRETMVLNSYDPRTSEIRAGRKSSRLLAGHLLTWIGTAISLTGNALFIAYYGQNNAQYYAGIGLTASAEPLMITGTILWILALRLHPAEAGP